MNPDELAEAVETTQPAASHARSLVERIRQRNEAKERRLHRPIPRWDGDVVVRYGRVGKKIIGLVADKPATIANAELLVASCVEVFVRDEEGRLQPAAAADGMPGAVRFDGRLSDLFELNADTPVKVVLAMYGDDVAIGADARRVMAWQTGADLDDFGPEEIDELAGEADAAT